MDESSGGRTRRIALVLIVIVVVGAWYFFQRPSVRKAADATVDAFVPGPQNFERGMDHVEEARRLTYVINARQEQALDELE